MEFIKTADDRYKLKEKIDITKPLTDEEIRKIELNRKRNQISPKEKLEKEQRIKKGLIYTYIDENGKRRMDEWYWNIIRIFYPKQKHTLSGVRVR